MRLVTNSCITNSLFQQLVLNHNFCLVDLIADKVESPFEFGQFHIFLHRFESYSIAAFSGLLDEPQIT